MTSSGCTHAQLQGSNYRLLIHTHFPLDDIRNHESTHTLSSTHCVPVVVESAVSANTEPRMLPPAVKSCRNKLWLISTNQPVFGLTWHLAAFQRSNPARRRITKSLTSWGISWIRIQVVVRAPICNNNLISTLQFCGENLTLKDIKKLPPMARPWVKLSVKFAIKFRYPSA